MASSEAIYIHVQTLIRSLAHIIRCSVDAKLLRVLMHNYADACLCMYCIQGQNSIASQRKLLEIYTSGIICCIHYALHTVQHILRTVRWCCK